MSATCGVVRTTPVVLGDGAAPVMVPMPPGYARVWSGFVRPGDAYLHRLAALDGEVVWVPITFGKLLADDGINDTAAWYSCVVRERPSGTDVGHPCRGCRCRPPIDGTAWCGVCDGPEQTKGRARR